MLFEKYNMLASTFFIFVQVCNVCPLVRTHCFSADEAANSFLLTVDLAESTVQLPLPVDLITVDLIEKYQQTWSAQISDYMSCLPFILLMKLNQSMHRSHFIIFYFLCRN